MLKNFKKSLKKKKKDKSKEKVDNLFNEIKTWKSKNQKSNLDLLHEYKDIDENQIITKVNDIILKAMSKWWSDIHIEPREKNIQIRIRVDGEFIKYKDFDNSIKNALIARIKIMSSLRIDEQRLPQDWKINFILYGWKSIDLRVSIIPTIYGEKVVIRLLKKEEKPQDLKALWILPYNMIKIKKNIENTNGMILAVWPTWSGKSTTLFSLLSQFDPEKRNISTLEDPVEYRIAWVNHTQINPSINFNFADGLRSLLRQDPDIIMVWEIRDEETAKLWVEASITWHLVFSTLHTNSASHTLQRLINLWIDPLLISSSLKMIISQRLARKLCPKCKIKYTPDENIKNKLIWRIWRYLKNRDNINLFKLNEEWCKYCNWSWYKWRIWLYEVLEMTEKIEELLLKKASKTQLEVQAIWDWMTSIKDDALIKVVMWETSLEEALRVLWW